MDFFKPGMSYSPCMSAGTEVVEMEGGRCDRRYLDVGENPPNGAIAYYWLPKDAEGPVKLTFADVTGKTIIAFSGDDKDAPIFATLVRAGGKRCGNGYGLRVLHQIFLFSDALLIETVRMQRCQRQWFPDGLESNRITR
ncbi:hypothetical protein NKI25_35230 [Mesorhizobium sp. M0808]|uniref:hypothetical protein n=1 Tax=Mesorhizobium sp. M0808 TaxID=2957002 RepID=UPI0033369CCA